MTAQYATGVSFERRLDRREDARFAAVFRRVGQRQVREELLLVFDGKDVDDPKFDRAFHRRGRLSCPRPALLAGSAGAAAVASLPSTVVVTLAPSSVSSLVDSAMMSSSAQR